MKILKNLSGSERRFIAFAVSMSVIVASGPLKLTDAALAALVTLTLGYIGQGAAKDAVLGRKQ